MRRKATGRQPAQLVTVSLILPRPLLEEIDAAARLLEVDRQTLLLRGFEVLSFAAAAMYGHDEHLELLRVS